MTLADLFQWISLGVFSGGVYVLWDLAKDVKELNEKIAVVIERTLRHEDAIKAHDERLRDLERSS